MFRRQPGKKNEKTLWTEYPDYNPIYNIDERPLFDESKVSDEHRVLGQIIRENWQLIHPLARDYILSSANEWRKISQEFQTQKFSSNDAQDSFESLKQDFELKMQRIILEKNAEIERKKEEEAEKFTEIIEQKDKEIAHYKMLADSVKSSYTERKITESNLESEMGEKDKRILALERLVTDLRSQVKTQEVEAMNVQTGISKNFQQQISEMTAELYNRQEQIEKLREILSKAKDQLIYLKEKNGELIIKNQQIESRIVTLEKALAEKDEKLRQVVKTIKNLD